MIITIDGPVASGKSSVARLLSLRCGYHYLSTGMFYRAIAYTLVTYYNYTVDMLADPRIADIDAIISRGALNYSWGPATQGLISYNKIVLNPFLKSAQIDKATSILAINPYLRKSLIDLWGRIVGDYDVVVEGRDTGSVVFPQAHVKFFLSASPEVRARRWQHDQAEQHHVFSYQQALEAIKDRDERDSKRLVSPLIVPQGAIMVDNSSLSLAQTVDYLEDIIKKKSCK